MCHITENRGGTRGRAWCWGVRVGETLTPEMGLERGCYIARGSVLVKCVQANACPPVHAPQAPSSRLAPSPKHTDQAGQFGSKQTWHMARQGDPACQQGLTSPSPLQNTRILLSAIPIQPTTTATAQTQSPLQNDVPCQEAFISPQVEQRRQIPSRKGYQIQGPPDASKQTRRARAHACA